MWSECCTSAYFGAVLVGFKVNNSILIQQAIQNLIQEKLLSEVKCEKVSRRWIVEATPESLQLSELRFSQVPYKLTTQDKYILNQIYY